MILLPFAGRFADLSKSKSRAKAPGRGAPEEIRPPRPISLFRPSPRSRRFAPDSRDFGCPRPFISHSTPPRPGFSPIAY